MGNLSFDLEYDLLFILFLRLEEKTLNEIHLFEEYTFLLRHEYIAFMEVM